MKKLVAILLTIAFAFGALCIPASAVEVISSSMLDNISWSLDTEGTLTISGEGDMTSSFVNYFWQVCNDESVKNLVISDGVTSIAEWAFFHCLSLTTVTISKDVTYIGQSTFFECPSLEVAFIKSPEVAAMITNPWHNVYSDVYKYFDAAGGISDNVETLIFANGITATDFVKETYPYTGTSVINGESVTWYKRVENCIVHYYEDEDDPDCNICGHVRRATALGDANGDGIVNNIDASLVLQHDAGAASLDSTALAAADVNADALVNNIDASRILQLDAGVISGF